MAKVQYSALIAGIRGKYMGGQLSVNRSGAVLQNKCQQRRGATASQSQARAKFAYLSRYWQSLSPSDVEANNLRSADYPYTDKFGNTRYFTGYQLLLRSNLNRAYSDLPPINIVPAPPISLPLALGSIELFIASPPALWNAFVTWVGTTPADVDYSVQVFMSPPVSSGVSVYSGRYNYVGWWAAYPDETVGGITNPPGLAAWSPGLRVFIRLVLIHNHSGIEVNSVTGSELINP